MFFENLIDIMDWFQTQYKLPDGVVVAYTGGSIRGRYPRVQIHTETWRSGLGQRWHRTLGAGYRKWRIPAIGQFTNLYS